MPVCRTKKYRSVVLELKKTPDVKQVLHLEKLDFMRFYKCKNSKKESFILDLFSGTGRYSIQLAKEGMYVSVVELVESNFEVLRENSIGIDNIKLYQGDATNLDYLSDNSFDVTLSLGPLYHLYEPEDIHKAIDEAICVTKPGGVMLFAFLSVFGIMYANYFYGNWSDRQNEYFTKDYKVKHDRVRIIV